MRVRWVRACGCNGVGFYVCLCVFVPPRDSGRSARPSRFLVVVSTAPRGWIARKVGGGGWPFGASRGKGLQSLASWGCPGMTPDRIFRMWWTRGDDPRPHLFRMCPKKPALVPPVLLEAPGCWPWFGASSGVGSRYPGKCSLVSRGNDPGAAAASEVRGNDPGSALPFRAGMTPVHVQLKEQYQEPFRCSSPAPKGCPPPRGERRPSRSGDTTPPGPLFLVCVCNPTVGAT